MKPLTNRYGLKLTKGLYVSFHLARGGTEQGTVAKTDRCSDFAKAYGAQVSFSDNPRTVAADDCFLPASLS
jgi:hypothetical protein